MERVMHLTVVTAVLLSVGILNAVTAQSETEKVQDSCKSFEDVSCGDGWSRIDDDFCAKFFQTPKSFDDAKEHCKSLDSELLSMKTPEQMMNAVCITHRDNPEIDDVWIGVVRSGDDFTNADGSYTYGQWYPEQPDNFGGQENCVEMNHKDCWGCLNDDNCSDENFFMCSKKA